MRLAAALVLVSTLAPLVRSSPPEPGPSPSLAAPPSGALLTLRDGNHLIHAERSSTEPHRVHLQWPDGRATVATVGPYAIVIDLPPSPDGPTPPSASSSSAMSPPLELAVVRPLMPRAGLTLVRSTRPDEDGLALAARLADRLQIFPDLALSHTKHAIDVPPDDPRHGGQWYLDRIDIHDAWRLETGDPSVVIGVVDDGCDLAHPDLADHMESGTDLVDHDDDPSYLADTDGNEHGTACAGLVAAIGDNGIGIAGTCPECHLRCVRLLPGGRGGDVSLSDDIAAFERQLAWNVAVSSNSWGFTDRFPVPSAFRRAISTLISESRDGLGAIVVFAAGNDAREIFPDELYGIDGVLTIGAINAFDEAASFSNHGGPLDLVAPAGTLTTDISGRDGADPGDYTSLFGGTSSACPVAAGVAALLVAAAPDKPASELLAALLATARPAPFALPDETGHDALYGFGVIDPTAALLSVAPPDPPADEGPDTVESDTTEPTETDTHEAEPDVAEAEPAPIASGGCTTGSAPLASLLALALMRRRRPT
jgi:subtilisin family serine protease